MPTKSAAGSALFTEKAETLLLRMRQKFSAITRLVGRPGVADIVFCEFVGTNASSTSKAKDPIAAAAAIEW